MPSASSSSPKPHPSPDHKPSGKKQWILYIGVVLIILLFALINFFVYRYSQGKVEEKRESQRLVSSLPPTPTLTPTPTPTPKSIPSGKKTFTVSSGKKTGPQFRTGFIDPYDPKKGSPQTISVSLISKNPITTVKLTMKTDTKSKEVPMTMTSGTPTEGTWDGTWTIDDTYLYTYNATIEASDGQETNSITITLR